MTRLFNVLQDVPVHVPVTVTHLRLRTLLAVDMDVLHNAAQQSGIVVTMLKRKNSIMCTIKPGKRLSCSNKKLSTE